MYLPIDKTLFKQYNIKYKDKQGGKTMDYEPYYIIYKITEPTLKACYVTSKKSEYHAIDIAPTLAEKLKKVQVTSNKTEFTAFGVKFYPKELNGKILFFAEPEFDYCFSSSVLKNIKPKTSYYDLFKKLIASVDNSYIDDDEDVTDYVYGKDKGAENCE